jgi:hypothetical protein
VAPRIEPGPKPANLWQEGPAHAQLIWILLTQGAETPHCFHIEQK